MIELKEKTIKLIEKLNLNEFEKKYVLLKLVHTYNHTCVTMGNKTRINIYNTSIAEIMKNEKYLSNERIANFQAVFVGEYFNKHCKVNEDDLKNIDRTSKNLFQSKIEWFTIELIKHYQDELKLKYEIKNTEQFDLGILFNDETKEDYSRDLQIKLILIISDFVEIVNKKELNKYEIRYFIFKLLELFNKTLYDMKLTFRIDCDIKQNEFDDNKNIDVVRMYEIIRFFSEKLSEDMNYYSNFIQKIIKVCNDNYATNIIHYTNNGNDEMEIVTFDNKGHMTINKDESGSKDGIF